LEDAKAHFRPFRTGRFADDPKRWYGASFSTTIDPNNRLERQYDRWEAVAQEITSDEKEQDTDDIRPEDYLDKDEDEEDAGEEEGQMASRSEDEGIHMTKRKNGGEGDGEHGNLEPSKRNLILEDEARGGERGRGRLKEQTRRPPPLEYLLGNNKRPIFKDIPKQGEFRQDDGDSKGSDAEKPDRFYLEDRKKAMEEIGLEQPQNDPEFEKWLEDHPKRFEFAASIARDIINQTEGLPPMKSIAAKLRAVEEKEQAGKMFKKRVQEGKRSHVDSWKLRQQLQEEFLPPNASLSNQEKQ